MFWKRERIRVNKNQKTGIGDKGVKWTNHFRKDWHRLIMQNTKGQIEK